MKLLHTADWHLGKKLEHLSRFDEQVAVLDEIVQIAEAENVDAVLIAGDLFDTFNPTSESEELFYTTLTRLSRGGSCAVVAIAGNHDAPERIEAPTTLARTHGIILLGHPRAVPPSFSRPSGLKVLRTDAGFVELSLPAVDYPLRLALTPYANEYRLRRFLGAEKKEQQLIELLQAHWQQLADAYCDDQGVNILTTHLFFAERGTTHHEEPEGEKPILHVGGAQVIPPSCIPAAFQYAALGHLHRPHALTQSACPVVYSGSPLAYSFAEVEQKKSVQIVEVAPGESAQWKSIPLQAGRPLLRERFTEVESAVKWLHENPEAIPEVTMVTEQFLPFEDVKRLKAANPDLFLIPEVADQAWAEPTTRSVNLNQTVNELFIDYFRYKHGGLKPDEDLLALLSEVLAEEKVEE